MKTSTLKALSSWKKFISITKPSKQKISHFQTQTVFPCENNNKKISFEAQFWREKIVAKKNIFLTRKKKRKRFQFSKMCARGASISKKILFYPTCCTFPIENKKSLSRTPTPREFLSNDGFVSRIHYIYTSNLNKRVLSLFYCLSSAQKTLHESKWKTSFFKGEDLGQDAASFYVLFTRKIYSCAYTFFI